MVIARLIRAIADWLRRILEWLRSLFGGGGTIEDDKCCHLARLDKECRYFGSKENFSCPEGFHRQWWFCCEGTQILGCGECTASATTCWSGPWECSIFWTTPQRC